MLEKFRDVLVGVSLLPVLVVVPAVADIIPSVQFVGEGETLMLSDLIANSFNTGVIYNAGTVIINGTSQFTNNTGITSGGVITNTATGTFTIGNVGFVGNSGATGAALYNMGVANFNGTALFGDNTATEAGGVFNSGTMTFNQSATFSDNKSQENGTAIQNESTGVMNFRGGLVLSGNDFIAADDATTSTVYNLGTMTVVGGNVLVSGNTAHSGAGINNSGVNSRLLLGARFDDDGNVIKSQITNITFQNNTATDGTAGALYAGGDTELYATNILFDNNDSNGVGMGGAIALGGGTLKIIGNNNTFTNNDANGLSDEPDIQYEFGGGAIQNMGNITPSNITIGDSASINTFATNTSAGYGGAIHARAVGESEVASTVVNGTTTFSANHAALNGGAISNYVDAGQSTFTFNGNTRFIGNTADGLGGALYNIGANNGVMTFNGNVVFSGNSDNTGANDIYNDGTIAFNGNVTLDGGITGSGTLSLANGKSLNIGGASITQNSIVMNGGFIVATLVDVDDDYRINVGTFGGEGTIALTLSTEGTYKVFGDSVFGNTVFEGDINLDSPFYNLVWIDDLKSVTASRKTADQIASDTGLSGNAAQTVLNLMDSSSDRLNDLGMAAQEQLAVRNLTAVEQLAHAIHPEMKSVIQSVSTSVQNSIANLAAGRMSLVRPSIGRSGGDTSARAGIWAEGMYNKSKQNNEFDGYTYGIVAGVDTVVANGFMMGVGYSYARSDMTVMARDTEIDSDTIFAYGQYKPNAWYVNAMLGYTMSDYKEQSDVLGGRIESDFDVNTFGAHVMTGYDFAYGITPELGMRYMHISSDEYKNSLAIKSDLDDSDYLTAIFGTKYAFDYRVSRRLSLRPELRAAVKYDLVSDKQMATVVMPGLNAYVLNGERLARTGGDFGGGIVMKYKDFSLALNYDIEVRKDYTSQTGRVRARMVF